VPRHASRHGLPFVKKEKRGRRFPPLYARPKLTGFDLVLKEFR